MPRYIGQSPFIGAGEVGRSIAETLAQSLIKLPMLRMQLEQQQQDRQASAQRTQQNDAFRQQEFTERQNEFKQRESDSQQRFKSGQQRAEQFRLGQVQRNRQQAQQADVRGAQFRATQKTKESEDTEKARHNQAMEGKGTGKIQKPLADPLVGQVQKNIITEGGKENADLGAITARNMQALAQAKRIGATASPMGLPQAPVQQPAPAPQQGPMGLPSASMQTTPVSPAPAAVPTQNVPRGNMPTPSVQPPPEHVNFLLKNPAPKVVADFEQKYGAGSAAKFLQPSVQ